MSEDPETTSNSASPEKTAKTWTVSEYNRSVERFLKKQVPQVWVKGVITQVNHRGKVVYLNLAEFEEGDSKPKATLDVIMWSWDFDVFNARFAQLRTPFSIRTELKVSFLVEANFYVPTGRFQPRVMDVDEAFTLGELSLTRQKILDRLVKENLIERNKQLLLSETPLRVGLITAAGSAAYKDFTTVLLQSGFSFEIFFASARMQGVNTEDTVTQSLESLTRQALDVICIVRGGGSKTDLVFFDSEKICRAIALCPVPVLTGIGHEIDRSLADMVAFMDLITPTDCAKFLESRIADAFSGLQNTASTLREAWQMAYQESGYDAIRMAESLRSSWESRARREALLQSEILKGLGAGTRRLFRAAGEGFVLSLKGLSRGPFKISRLETQALELKERLVQSADPAVLLRKGFALVFSSDGNWIRGAAEVAAGDTVRTRFQDGDVLSEVKSKEKSPWNRS